MSEFRHALADYLSLRRSLGYKLRRPEKLLHQFIAFLQNTAPRETITTKNALAWACQPENSKRQLVGPSSVSGPRVRELPACRGYYRRSTTTGLTARASLTAQARTCIATKRSPR